MHKVLAEVMYLHRAGKSNRKYETLRKKDTALDVLCEVRSDERITQDARSWGKGQGQVRG